MSHVSLLGSTLYNETHLLLQGRAAHPTSHSAALSARAPDPPVLLGAIPVRPLVSISDSHCTISSAWLVVSTPLNFFPFLRALNSLDVVLIFFVVETSS